MPSVKIHCALSRERTGRSFKELHLWIDEFQEELGTEHRSRRHFWNSRVKNYIEQWWNRKEKGLGKIAVEEWLFHISIDNMYTLYKYHKHNTPMSRHNNFFAFGILDNGYIHYLEGEFGENKMKDFFGEIDKRVEEETIDIENDIEEFF